MDKEIDVAIFTGWSKSGGSTESYINLVNAFNERGINSILIGPHDWHLDKCNGAMLSEDFSKLNPKNVIWHFLDYPKNCSEKFWKDSNFILSCHETNIKHVFESYQPQISNNIFDHFHFVSESQANYQLAKYTIKDLDLDAISIIPNIIDPKLLKVEKSLTEKIGGVIGSIDWNKQTHVAITNALNDGCDTVRVFGKITDKNYFYKHVEELFKNPKVLYHGLVDDKNKMYGSISDVYHYSLKESWGYIKYECAHLGIPFHSNDTTPIPPQSSDQIISAWKNILI